MQRIAIIAVGANLVFAHDERDEAVHCDHRGVGRGCRAR
jgi:hypothetical protein